MRPPVNIGRQTARELTSTLLSGYEAYADGAGGYGHKQASNAPIALRSAIGNRGPQASPNSSSNRSAAIPLGRLPYKQGYPHPHILPSGQTGP